MIFVHEELFKNEEKNYTGKMLIDEMNKYRDDDRQIGRFTLYIDVRLRNEWRSYLRKIFEAVRSDMENDPEFLAEKEAIEERFDDEMLALVDRWKAKNLKRSIHNSIKEIV